MTNKEEFDGILAQTADISKLQKTIDSATLLIKNIKEGNNEGEFPCGTRNLIYTSIENANPLLCMDLAQISQKEINKAIYEVNTACMDAESNVINSKNILNDKKATKETSNLFQNLQNVAPNGFLYGMHDATSYGIGWSDDGSANRSDVKDVCGSHPAVFSWDFADIVELNNAADIKRRIEVAYNQKGVITLCWHQENPFGGDSWAKSPEAVTTIFPGGVNHEKYMAKLDKIAEFAKSLRGPSGESIPILFRPYHEQSGDWFWWGRNRCANEDYNKLWQMTHDYLRDIKGVHNFIYVQSPDGHQLASPKNYMDMYPGNKYVDVVGLDFYFGTGDKEEISKLVDRLKYISDFAKATNKVAALAETGDRQDWNEHDQLLIPNWYTRCFLDAMKTAGVEMAYGAVWRNGAKNHHFAPYLGHAAVENFMSFYKDKQTLFQIDMPDFYKSIIPKDFTKTRSEQNTNEKVSSHHNNVASNSRSLALSCNERNNNQKLFQLSI